MAAPKGRPSLYAPELANRVLTELAEGRSLSEICRGDDFPSRPTVHSWITADIDGFSARYARARELQVERWADEILEISDDGTNDWALRQQSDEAVTVADYEHIQRSRLRVDARKWLMSKIIPHRYGDKQQVEHTGNVNVRDERRERIAEAVVTLFGTAEDVEPSGKVVH